MAIIRLTHVADLPDPEALIRKVQASVAAGEFARGPATGQSQRSDAPQAMAPRAARPSAPVVMQDGGAATALAVSPEAIAGFPDFAAVIELIRRMRDMQLLLQVEDHLRLVRYSPGRIEFQPTENAPRELAQRLGERLRGWTGGYRWTVTVTGAGGAPTISEARAAEKQAARDRAMEDPVVQAIFAAFPQAKITDIRAVPAAPQVEISGDGDTSPHDQTDGPVAEVEEWDPFEDEE